MTEDASQQGGPTPPPVPGPAAESPEVHAQALLHTTGKFSIEVALSEALMLMGRFPGKLLAAFGLVMLIYLAFQTPYLLGQSLSGDWQKSYEALSAMINDWQGFVENADAYSQPNEDAFSPAYLAGLMLSLVGGILYGVFFGPIWGGFYLLILRLLRATTDTSGTSPTLVFAGFGSPILQLILVSLAIGIAYIIISIIAAIIFMVLVFVLIVLIAATAGSGSTSTYAALVPFLLAAPFALLFFIIINMALCLFNYAVQLVIDQKLDFWNATEVSVRLVWRRLFDVFLWRVLAYLILVLGWIFVFAGLFFGLAQWDVFFVGALLLFAAIVLAFTFLLTTLADLSVYDQMFVRHLRRSS